MIDYAEFITPIKKEPPQKGRLYGYSLSTARFLVCRSNKL